MGYIYVIYGSAAALPTRACRNGRRLAWARAKYSTKLNVTSTHVETTTYRKRYLFNCLTYYLNLFVIHSRNKTEYV